MQELETKKQKVIILSGVPASGKSTWSSAYIQKFPNTLILNRDSYRVMLNGYKHIRSVEKSITKMFYSDMKILLEDGFDLILDNTHTSTFETDAAHEVVNDLKENGHDITIEHYLLDAPLEICMERNNRRNPVRRVPNHVMASKYAQIKKLRLEKPFNKIIYNG